MSNQKEVPVESIPEVASFVAEQERLRQFVEANKDFFTYLQKLASAYNDALAMAVSACKQRDVGCGPIVRIGEGTTYDFDALFDLVGRDRFIEAGGKVKRIEKRTGDKRRVDMAIARGAITSDQAALVKKTTGRFRKIDPISIPDFLS